MSQSRKRPANNQEDAWVAGEDKFVLEQAKKKAAIRVKEGRAQPVDWLAVTLRFIDNSRSIFDDEVQDADLDVVDPEGVFEGLSEAQLRDLGKDIDFYVALERNPFNSEFWSTMKVICNDRHLKQAGPKGRAQDSVNQDVEKIFSSKTYEQLEALEKQIRTKLRSPDIEVEYWQNLLQNCLSWKARARLRQVSQSIIDSQSSGLIKQEVEEARLLALRLSAQVKNSSTAITSSIKPDTVLDPDPLLKVREEDKKLEVQDESDFLSKISMERRKVLKLGFVPSKRKTVGAVDGEPEAKRTRVDDSILGSSALYEREKARGLGQNEEMFASEANVSRSTQSTWSHKYQPRKPQYYNRVQMGYEWNKYNQTHYDHENPPPKVVQGYRFNIFYPDLIDKTKAPTYKIERENGRKRGQSFATAGEEDTCVIKFIAGPPYEDIAFRIVDKEWDYSSKRERGFKSSFDKGVLSLWFSFKKIFYRK